MRKTFLSWLMIFMIGAFAVAFFISFYIQTNHASDNAEMLIQLKIEDIEKQLDINKKNIVEIREESDSNALAKASAFAKMIEMNPEILNDFSELNRIKDILDVDELHVSNEAGILIAGTMESYIGYDFASDSQSGAFLPALNDKNFKLAQDPLPKGIDGEIFQYAGVARLDSPGIVQIGYRPEKLAQAMEVADIKNLAPGFRVGKSGSIMVADLEGSILSAHKEEYLGKNISEYGLPKEIFKESQGSFIGEIEGEKNLFYYNRYNGFYIIGQLPADEMYLNRNSTITLLGIFNILLFVIVFILIAKLVQSIVISGIYKINKSLAKITAGDLDEVVDVCTNPEFTSLSQGINTTVDALKKAIKEAESRIDSELDFARAIQHSAMPVNNSLKISKEKVDVYGGMFTAKEVGGDFYDFFMIDDDHLGFVIADVSGKGIPAALFMMVSKTIIKQFALTGISPAEVLYKTNNSLCENNEKNMFVTAIMGSLDLKTGEIIYANAGHNTPLISRKENGFQWMKSNPSFVLGGMEDIEYKNNIEKLDSGEKLFLYTDGVTEAVDIHNNLYSNEKLFKTLNGFPREMEIHDVLEGVKIDVDEFSSGAEQADDITILVIEYRGRD
jgi:serine phosphatase RsbU (regulator of sigma subunit)